MSICRFDGRWRAELHWRATQKNRRYRASGKYRSGIPAAPTRASSPDCSAGDDLSPCQRAEQKLMGRRQYDEVAFGCQMPSSADKLGGIFCNILQNVDVKDDFELSGLVDALDCAGDHTAAGRQLAYRQSILDATGEITIGLEARPFADKGCMQIGDVAADARADLEPPATNEPAEDARHTSLQVRGSREKLQLRANVAIAQETGRSTVTAMFLRPNRQRSRLATNRLLSTIGTIGRVHRPANIARLSATTMTSVCTKMIRRQWPPGDRG